MGRDGAQDARGTKTGNERFDHSGSGRADAVRDDKALAKVKKVVFLEDALDGWSAEKLDVPAKIIVSCSALSTPSAGSAWLAGN